MKKKVVWIVGLLVVVRAVIGLLMDLPSNGETVVDDQTVAASGFVEETVCLSEGGLHVLEVKSPSGENMAAGYLSLIDNPVEGELVASAIRTRDGPKKVRNEPVDSFPTYDHEFPQGDRRPTVRARLYPNELITKFNQQLDRWMRDGRARKYLGDRDEAAILPLDRVLAALPPPAA